MGSSGGKGGGTDWIDWAMNPVGSIGKTVFGIQLDPISDATANMFKYTTGQMDNKEEGNMLGNSFLADWIAPAFGGTTEETRRRSKDDAWQSYFTAVGKDKFGKRIEGPKAEVLKNKVPKSADAISIEGDSLLG